MKKLFLILSVIALFAGLIFFRGWQMRQQESNLSGPPVKPEVEFVTAAPRIFEDRVKYVANLEPYEKAAVISKVPGKTVLQVFVEEGDSVKEGDILTKIDDSLVNQDIARGRASVQSALSQYRAAESDYKRMKQLYEEKVISEQNYEQVKTRYESARSQLQEARAAFNQLEIQLSYHQITAPVDGVISARLIDPGDTTSLQSPAFMIYKQDKLRVTGVVTERKFAALKKGQTAEITVDAIPEKVFSADVTRLSPVIDPVTRTGEVEVILHSGGILKPGMFARVSIRTGGHEGIALPRDVVRKIPGTGDYRIYILSDKTARERIVKTGSRENNRIEITENLEAGERVISTLSEKVRDGAAVEVVTD